jgi:hypothetical protein
MPPLMTTSDLEGARHLFPVLVKQLHREAVACAKFTHRERIRIVRCVEQCDFATGNFRAGHGFVCSYGCGGA